MQDRHFPQKIAAQFFAENVAQLFFVAVNHFAPYNTPMLDLHDAPTPDAPQSNSRESFFSLQSLWFVLAVLIVVLPIRFFVAKPFIVSGASMDPTFATWHYLIIDQLSYRLHDPQRGDVITFRFPQDPSRFFIKRIIGLPGETVTLDGYTVTITNTEHPNGFILNEPYIADKNQKRTNMVITLGSDEYFVMGDNRLESADSRYWGPLEQNRIIGRAFVRLFPLDQIGILPGSTTYTEIQ